MLTKGIRKEIDNFFALKSSKGAYAISSLGRSFPAWVITTDDEYGVCIDYEGENINESFSKVSIRNSELLINGKDKHKALLLTCTDFSYRKEFSFICEEFVFPGERGENRAELLSHPLNWWRRWKELMGNTQKNKMVYDVVGELSALLKLLSSKDDPYWSATGLSTHDIETSTASYEVKSSIVKDRSVIHVNSQFQLQSGRPLYLIFTRLEESLSGDSIDDLMGEIKKYDLNNISAYEEYLSQKGFKPGNHSRKIKYSILERRKILVNSEFPKITEDMFKEEKYPSHITHIEYDVDLDGLDYENWK